MQFFDPILLLSFPLLNDWMVGTTNPENFSETDLNMHGFREF